MSFQRRLIAADGYCELGMADEALREISRLSPEEQNTQAALEMKLKVAMQAHRWELGLEICAVIRELFPLDTLGFVHGAYCLHALDRTADARAMLLAGPPALLQDPTYYYNLGCYDAVLGHHDEARRSLRTSFRMNKTYLEWAKEDPDLVSLNAWLDEEFSQR
jgi:predicted Zn-dependent protease